MFYNSNTFITISVYKCLLHTWHFRHPLLVQGGKKKCWLTLFDYFVHFMDLFRALVHGHLTGPCHIKTRVLNLATHAARYGCQDPSTSSRQKKLAQVPNISQLWTLPLHVGGCWLHWRLAWHWAVDGPSMV